MYRWLAIAVLCAGMGAASAQDEKTIGVFVALADNATQGLVPVPEAIGNGNDPEKNLYWGTAEGLKGIFDHSKHWKRIESKDDTGDPNILRIRTYRHQTGKAILEAKAYRGSSIRQCLEDFEKAVGQGSYDLVVFIGHNGLMDFELPRTSHENTTESTDCIVLCCKSDQYFAERLKDLAGKPVLLTRQFMYPGAFLLETAAEGWLVGENLAEIRTRAGRAYAENQEISQKSALGVFAELEP